MAQTDKYAVIEGKVQQIYDKGKTDGYAEGYSVGEVDGIELGKRSEWDTFWDSFQEYGNRTNYKGAFDVGWDDNNFKPKHVIKPSSAADMFNSNRNINDSIYTDRLDFSEAKNASSTFSQCSNLTKLKIIDLRKSNGCGGFCNKCTALKSIDAMYMPTYGSVDKAFAECGELTSIGIMGDICVNGLDFKDCTKLDRATIIGIISALSTESTVNGFSITFSATAVNNAFTSEEWNGTENQVGWKNYKSNWTIYTI